MFTVQGRQAHNDTLNSFENIGYRLSIENEWSRSYRLLKGEKNQGSWNYAELKAD